MSQDKKLILKNLLTKLKEIPLDARKESPIKAPMYKMSDDLPQNINGATLFFKIVNVLKALIKNRK